MAAVHPPHLSRAIDAIQDKEEHEVSEWIDFRLSQGC